MLRLALKGRAGKTKAVKQTTLFNLPPPAATNSEKQAKGKKPQKGDSNIKAAISAKNVATIAAAPKEQAVSAPERSLSPVADLEEESQATLDADDDEEVLDETQPASYIEGDEERQGSPDWGEPAAEDEDVEMGNGTEAISSLD